MFRVISGSRGVGWRPIDSGVTLYNGQLCKEITTGFGPLAVASGAGDGSGLQVIQGIVIANNDKVSQINATYGTYISGVTSQASQNARDYRGNDGNFPVGDQKPLVQVEFIGPETLIAAPVFASGTVINTALATLTVTTGSTTGLGFTSNAADFTPVANICTSYCRSGANMGVSEISSDTSTTVETNTIGFPNDIAISDTFVRVPYKIGQSYAQINSTSGALGLWLDGTASPATDYYIINVERMDLQISGEETIYFRFAPCHFDAVRA